MTIITDRATWLQRLQTAEAAIAQAADQYEHEAWVEEADRCRKRANEALRKT